MGSRFYVLCSASLPLGNLLKDSGTRQLSRMGVEVARTIKASAKAGQAAAYINPRTTADATAENVVRIASVGRGTSAELATPLLAKFM